MDPLDWSSIDQPLRLTFLDRFHGTGNRPFNFTLKHIEDVRVTDAMQAVEEENGLYSMSVKKNYTQHFINITEIQLV